MEQDEEALDQWQAELTPEARDAIASSLDKLEWRALLEQVGRFCATALGRERVYAGELGVSRKDSQRLLAETAAAVSLETQYCLTLDFGGANTALVRGPCGRQARACGGGHSPGVTWCPSRARCRCATRCAK